MFVMENPIFSCIDDNWGCPHDLGNLPMSLCFQERGPNNTGIRSWIVPSLQVIRSFHVGNIQQLLWVNYNELTTSSLEIIVSKGNHPQMALIQVSALLYIIYPDYCDHIPVNCKAAKPAKTANLNEFDPNRMQPN